MSTGTGKKSMFVMPDGKNLMFTFILVSSLFLLWGVCNGMIDVMDKHFQNELSLTKSQSAWVQFAHYLGYFLMAMPAGWLASRIGYKGGIIIGLLLAAAGGLWFLPATYLANSKTVSDTVAFVGFLAGVCTIAAGLTFLETVANPYTTVLGPQRYSATRINLAQSCNGVGWICGPFLGAWFFYGKNAAGQSTGSQTLFIPYVMIAGVAIALAVAFYFANVPDIKAEDDYKIDEKDAAEGNWLRPERSVKRFRVFVLLLLNSIVLLAGLGMITYLILSAGDIPKRLVGLASRIPNPLGVAVTAENSPLVVICAAVAVLAGVAFLALIPTAARITHRSMWSHPHFSAAVLTQFCYTAAQTGIFSFLINYMTEEVPPIPALWRVGATKNWIDVKTKVTRDEIKDLPAFVDRLKRRADPVSAFLSDQLSDETKGALKGYNASLANPNPLLAALAADLNKIVKQESKSAGARRAADGRQVKTDEPLYTPQRFSGISLGEKTRQLLQNPKVADTARLNRLLLADAYPGVIAYDDARLSFSDSFAANLAAFGFVCFLVGRFTGAGLLRRFSAHKIVALYALLNVVACLLVFLKLGWVSVACVFLSYFFMSIMFPTIFALGIFGLGAKAKKASAFIVMAIMGGAMVPKLMGHVADLYDMSRGFAVPMCCFVAIALYGLAWPALSNAKSLHSEAAGD